MTMSRADLLRYPTVENSLLQVDTRELCKEENRAIAVAYLQGINWARSAAMIFFPPYYYFFFKDKPTRFVQTALTNERAARIHLRDRLENPPPLLFLPQDRLTASQSALKSCVIHKLRQKYTFNMMGQSMTSNISDNSHFRKFFFFFF